MHLFVGHRVKRSDHLMGFSSSSCLSVQLCSDILLAFSSVAICEHFLFSEVKINIVFGVGGNSVALFSLQAGNNFEK